MWIYFYPVFGRMLKSIYWKMTWLVWKNQCVSRLDAFYCSQFEVASLFMLREVCLKHLFLSQTRVWVGWPVAWNWDINPISWFWRLASMSKYTLIKRIVMYVHMYIYYIVYRYIYMYLHTDIPLSKIKAWLRLTVCPASPGSSLRSELFAVVVGRLKATAATDRFPWAAKAHPTDWFVLWNL